MKVLDIILLVVIGLCMIDGLKRGLSRQLLELGGVVAAFIIASRYGVALGQVLSRVLKLENYASTLDNPFLNVDAVATTLYNALGYILLFIAVVITARLLAVAVGAVAKLPVIGTADKAGGLAVGFLKGALIVLVAVWILNLLPIPQVAKAVESSKIAHVFLAVAPGLYQRLRDLIGAGLQQG